MFKGLLLNLNEKMVQVVVKDDSLDVEKLDFEPFLENVFIGTDLFQDS